MFILLLYLLLCMPLLGFYLLNCNVYYDLRTTYQESLKFRDNHNPLVT